MGVSDQCKMSDYKICLLFVYNILLFVFTHQLPCLSCFLGASFSVSVNFSATESYRCQQWHCMVHQSIGFLIIYEGATAVVVIARAFGRPILALKLCHRHRPTQILMLFHRDAEQQSPGPVCCYLEILVLPISLLFLLI